jgi:hypothetical protein
VSRHCDSAPSERACNAPEPYSILSSTLDDCIREFIAKPVSAHHLYEIHTAPQGELVTAILSPQQVAEIIRLRDFL